jgi:DNA-binding transcriptional regulator YdaS (Cro superfamily)
VTVYARTLHRACEVVGGLDALSRHLGASNAAITRWIGGFEQPPLDKFLAAVDIVLLADGPGLGSA